MEQNEIYNQQKNLDQINVKSAWTELEKIKSSIKYGDDSIVVAVVDFVGIESQSQIVEGEEKIVPTNPVFGNINGKEKIPLFFRMATGEQNNDFSLLQSGNHGTCVAGIISATENDYSVMGVAPNIRLLSIELYELHPQNLNDRIGVSNILKHICLVPINNNKYLYNNEIYNFPEITAENAASILNFSIGIDDMNNLIYNTIDSLSIYGRTGLGAICVVAAGNDQIDFDILSEEKKYEHCLQLNKRTIVVTGANIYKKDGDIVGKYMYTNFGHRIDVTAPGNDIITTSCITLGDSYKCRLRGGFERGKLNSYGMERRLRKRESLNVLWE